MFEYFDLLYRFVNRNVKQITDHSLPKILIENEDCSTHSKFQVTYLYLYDLGHYLMIKPSASSRVPGDNKAYLIMPEVPSSGNTRSCVRFWYQISGRNVIALRLYMRTPGGALPQFSLWSHGSNEGNDTWRVGQRTIDAPYVHEVCGISFDLEFRSKMFSK